MITPGFNVYAARVEWGSRLSIGFDFVRHIRNNHNNNQSINMCKEFNVSAIEVVDQ